jgi:uncharacterized protein (DUF433 family)
MDNGHLDRISLDPGVMGGKACIRGTRVTVGRIVSQIGAGETIEELLADYPYIEREDIMQALHWAEIGLALTATINSARRPRVH